jgi:hypothetical protein
MKRALRNARELHLFHALMVLGGILLACVAFLWIGFPTKTRGPIQTGVTFSQIYATELGLNWRQTLAATLDDLGVRSFRIPAYWNIVEPTRGVYAWSSIDYQMNEIAKRDGKALLAIGMKLPRWPECWMPEWASTLSTEEEHRARLEYLTEAVNRYKNHPALQAWQVENEPALDFGICPPQDPQFHSREIATVRAADASHPITTTNSGELSTWLENAGEVDAVGISMYRIIRHAGGGIMSYDFIPPYWYARRAALVSPWVKRVFVSEFQMEPWVRTSIRQTPLSEQFQTFDLNRMRNHFDYAERTRFNEIYFWGVEWWYWMKTHQNDPTFWNMAKEFFARHAVR